MENKPGAGDIPVITVQPNHPPVPHEIVETPKQQSMEGEEMSASCHVSISGVCSTKDYQDEDSFEDLKEYIDEDTEAMKYSNELRQVLNYSGEEQLLRLRDVVDKTVNDVRYRESLAHDDYALDNLIQVLKQAMVKIEPLYTQMSMSVDALRMDTGNVDDHTKKMYLVKWSLIFRILNIFKNLLVANNGIQERLYEHKVALLMVKGIPKAMVAREIAIRHSASLLRETSDVGSSLITKGQLNRAVPICAKADVTLVTFFLNSMAASRKMQNFIRPQLWPGPLAILALTMVSSRSRMKGSTLRYSKDLANLISLFHTLFVNVNDAELADWWEFEPTEEWNPQGELGHQRLQSASSTQSASKTTNLQRTATNLSMQLSLPHWSTSGEVHSTDSVRSETVIGALLEPQVSAIKGKGVHIDRLKSYKKLAETSSGSLGFNGREGLLIIMSSIMAGFKYLEDEDEEDESAYQAFELLKIRMTKRGKDLDFWHAYWKSMNKCRAVSRILNTVAQTRFGPCNTVGIGKDDHQGESIYALMSSVLVNRLSSLFTLLNIGHEKGENDNDLLDNFHEHASSLNADLVRGCIKESIVNELILPLIHQSKGPDTSSSAKKEGAVVLSMLLQPVAVEADENVSFISYFLKGAEEADNARLERKIDAVMGPCFTDIPAYDEFVKEVAETAEEFDHLEPVNQVSSGSSFRITMEALDQMESGPMKLQLTLRAVSSAIRWLKSLNKFMALERMAKALCATETNSEEALKKVQACTAVRTYILNSCQMTATICFEMLLQFITDSVNNSEAKALIKNTFTELDGMKTFGLYTDVIHEAEPTLRERAALLIRAISESL